MAVDRSKCNPDIVKERDRCTFNIQELTNFIDGGEKKTNDRRKIEEVFLSDPVFKDMVPMEYLDHQTKYEENLRKACAIFLKFQEYQNLHGDGGIQQFVNVVGGMLGSGILGDGSPIILNYAMFIPTIMGQGTSQQQAEWISRAWNYRIIGTYAQTELGHGTFIRGLETIAEYDPETEEFILNSPTLTSYKWWPGGLGHTANYAVVVAQLYTKGECHGIQPFIVQLRDEETHVPMPGIKIGEIGVKMGMNGSNNGFLGFTNVRIPRENMLMKNAQVLQDGTFVKALNSKLTYGTMIEPEPQIMDYVTQQYKLFPNIAACFAFNLTADWLWEHYNNVTSELEAGDMDRLPEMHALACCLKAVCTADAAQGVEVCRLACGGHGFMICSNLPSTYGLVTAACTYEGENTVLLLQTARFLIKAWDQATRGLSMTPTVKYLMNHSRGEKVQWRMSIDGIINGFQAVAAGKIALCAKNIAKRMKEGLCYEDAWNMTSVQLVAAAEAHCRSFIIEKFNEKVNEALKKVSSPVAEVLKIFVELYGVYWALKFSGDLLMFSTITGSDLEGLQRWLEELLTKMRPNAVGIVDSFDIRDEILKSALGSYDGWVYERLMDSALKSPLNAEPVNKSFHLYLKPLMKSQL